MSVAAAYRPDPIHAALGDRFYDSVTAAVFPEHKLRYRNARWSKAIGLDTLIDDAWVNHFGRFVPLPDNLPQPLALRYHGHQFQVYNPNIGDGRGFLFAQVRGPDGRVLDLGTKGSGQTPYSRTGDGRLTLKGGVRELLATTFLEASGVNTSKTFSLIETGEHLTRNDEPSPTRSSVLVRLSHSNIRIGTFQRLAYEDDAAGIQRLIDHVLRHYMPAVWPQVANRAPAERAAAMFKETAGLVARTGAQWMAAGFVHGVLNTDNINITGESFDYGPYRFLPYYDPRFTAAYFDQRGLYAYAHQPNILAWNLERLGECLRLVAEEEPLVAALQSYAPAFEAELAKAWFARLNIAPREPADDVALVVAIYAFLYATQMPFEQFIFDWQGGRASAARAARSPVRAAYESPAFATLKEMLQPYDIAQPARLSHPYFDRERPETLVIDEIEAIWAAIDKHDDWQPLMAKCAALEDAGRAAGTIQD
jgi:uncharacterized protein YdiU (UPF0061 family)